MVKDESKIIGRFRLIGIPKDHIISDKVNGLRDLRWSDIGWKEKEYETNIHKFYYLLEN